MQTPQSPTQLTLGTDGLLGEAPTEPVDIAASKHPVESIKDLEANAEALKIRKKIGELADRTLDAILNIQILGIGELAFQQQLIGELRGLQRFELELALHKEKIKEEFESQENLTVVNDNNDDSQQPSN